MRHIRRRDKCLLRSNSKVQDLGTLNEQEIHKSIKDHMRNGVTLATIGIFSCPQVHVSPAPLYVVLKVGVYVFSLIFSPCDHKPFH